MGAASTTPGAGATTTTSSTAAATAATSVTRGISIGRHGEAGQHESGQGGRKQFTE